MEKRKAPEDCYYWVEDGKAVEHIWLRFEGEAVQIGITDIGIELMGELVSLSPKAVGREIEAGKGVATIETSKWVGPLSTPVKGEVIEVNEALVKNPSPLNGDPYGNWIVKLKIASGEIPPSLVTGAAGAEKYLKAANADLQEK